MKNFIRAAEQCERAAEACGTEAELVETFKALQHMEEIQVALLNRQLDRLAQTSMRREERLPLREDGDDIGRIEARVPKHVAFSLMQQKNFGFEGLTSDEGMRDLLKAYPQFGVKTVSGKTTVGFNAKTQRARRRKGVVFGKGTLNLAS